MIGDNLASHISSDVISKYADNNIRFILLPPNSTHLTQPLDVTVFRPIKASWRKIFQEWKKHNKETIRKEVFSRLLNQALNRVTASEKNIKSGFKATSILPLNRHKVLNKLPTTDTQKLQQEADIVDSLKDVLEKCRFKASTSVGRKKRLRVEAGKSISQKDLHLPSMSVASPKNKRPRKNLRPIVFRK